ncbi:MAG: calcium/sodium antiporter [Calditerrivibrio sp.]|nr:calcium/sodium antiporter [Calditerrivibrio sp.]
MLLLIFLFAVGLVILIVGSDLLVRGASKLAISMGVSPLVVGLTVVAFGTSAPELAVSVKAAWSGFPDMAVGNVVGSNIANILLILGLSAMVAPVVVHTQVVRQEIPVLVGTSALFACMALDGKLSKFDGGLLFLLIIVYTIFLVRQSRKESKLTQDEYAKQMPKSSWDDRLWVQVVLIIVGLVGLVWGADIAVKSAAKIAEFFGVSELIIGLTIVAVGTSLPEIATSVMAMVKGERDIAVGNVVGSNVFNILSVLGLSSLVSPSVVTINRDILQFDLWIMLGAVFVLIPIVMSGMTILRWEGLSLLLFYASYIVFLVLKSSNSKWLGEYAQIMMGFVAPLAIAFIMIRYVVHINKSGD